MLHLPQRFGHRLSVIVLLIALVASACSESSIVEPGPGDSAQSSTTTTQPEDEEGAAEGEVETVDAAPSTTLDTGGEEQSSDAPEEVASSGAVDSETTATTIVIDETSENAGAYTELAQSGLVLTLTEQACADAAATEAAGDGADPVDAVAVAVQSCASPLAIDNFASGLIEAGGAPLPPTEAACVSSQLQATEEYRPFWRALLDEEPFDFLLSDTEVQNRYLDLYSECVSVGRAVAQQAQITLSAPTQDCIDDLYNDREFVRVTLLADLSGDPDERARIDNQIAGCFTSSELALVQG